MQIKRNLLLKKLYDYFSSGNGLIVGKPGVGKSYLLKELQRMFYDAGNGVPALMLKVDTLLDYTDAAISMELGLSGDWIQILKRISLPGKKGVLIFDAFDAARDEVIRKGILNQIRKAVNELSESYNIIVTVRTYDASKSPELLRIFANSEIINELDNCRKQEIYELTDEEILEGILGNKILENLFQEASKELKEIIRIPFFLMLLEEISKTVTEREINLIKQYKSEAQLLKAYWQKKIINISGHIEKEMYVLKLTQALVGKRSLNILKIDFYEAKVSIASSVFDYLRSENIIDEVGRNRNQLSFSHNILFDYAVSIYLIPERPDELVSFINFDPSRPFFLRPSFVYFFTSEWYRDRDQFSQAYWKLSNIDSKEIKLLVRLILNGIIASEYSCVEDFVAITNHPSNSTPSATIRDLLQSIKFIRKPDVNKDATLILYLSKNLQLEYIFEVSFLLDREIAAEKSKDNLILYGEAARNLLRYILSQRRISNREFLDRIGYSRAVSMVAQTFSTDILESKNLFFEILAMIQEANFEIGYLSQLSDNVKFILPFDKEFVALIYLTIFGHIEVSNEETQIGGSVLMNFRSNRRQDFEMCHFRLKEFFPEFLRQTPKIAIETGLEIVNKFVIEFEIRRPYETIEFDFIGRKCNFIPDISAIWAHDVHSYEWPDIANKIIAFLESQFTSGNSNFETYLNEYIQNAKVAYTWRLLFELGSRYPEKLANTLFPLISILFLQSIDIKFYLIKFIEKAGPYFNKKQISQIERSVFSAFDKGEVNSIASVLSRLPFTKLSFVKSKKIVTKSGIIVNKPPIIFHSSVNAVTSEMWMEERGVDINAPGNALLIESRQKLEAFNNIWRNGKPSIEDYSSFLETALNTFSELDDNQTTLHSDLFYSVLKEVASSLSIVCKNLVGCTAEQIDKIKKAVVYSFNYLTEFESSNEGKSPSGGWSSTPRIEAAESLIYLYIYDSDEVFLELFKEALNDNVPVVRFMAVQSISLLAEKNYNTYWKLYIERIEKEEDGFIYAALLRNIHVDLKNVEIQTNTIIDFCLTKEQLFQYSDSFTEAFAETIIWLFRSHRSKRAYQELSSAVRIPKLCKNILFQLCNALHPSYLYNEFAKHPEKYEALFQIIASYVDKCGRRLSQAKEEEFKSENEEIKNSFDIIHEVIVRLYFQLNEVKIGQGQNRFSLPVNDENRRALYFIVKPIYQNIVSYSSKIIGRGLIIGSSAHYFIQSLNRVLHYDVEGVLSLAASITRYSLSTGYTYDPQAIGEMVKLTEKLLADHRDVLLDDASFKNLIDILDMYIDSGSVEALKLLWRLDEVFR